MFGLGFTEILILALIAFLVFGPKQFPTVARSFVKLLNELRMAFSEVKTEFDSAQNEAQKHIHQLKDHVGQDILSIKDSLKEEFSLISEDLPRPDDFPSKKNSEDTKQNLRETTEKQKKK